MSETQKQITGRIGEDAAASFYKDKGYKIVERNVHIYRKEIDLVVEDETCLVFVEVKTRSQKYGVRSPYGRPADAVDSAKRHNIVVAAQVYLRMHPTRKQPRIDVIEVYVSAPKEAEALPVAEKVIWFRNAFGAKSS